MTERNTYTSYLSLRATPEDIRLLKVYIARTGARSQGAAIRDLIRATAERPVRA